MDGNDFKAVVEEFRQYIITQNVKHLEYVASLVEDAINKENQFRKYVDEQREQGYMIEILRRLGRPYFGASSVSKRYNGRPESLFYGYHCYLKTTYPWYFKMTEKYSYGKMAVDGETREEMFVRIATDDANKCIENFMAKVEEKAGEIEGAKELYLRAGNINGIVVGSNADVKVTTFGAGGWNIQRFHFRTKITALKQRA